VACSPIAFPHNHDGVDTGVLQEMADCEVRAPSFWNWVRFAKFAAHFLVRIAGGRLARGPAVRLWPVDESPFVFPVVRNLDATEALARGAPSESAPGSLHFRATVSSARWMISPLFSIIPRAYTASPGLATGSFQG
jgi:hypothetical protein